MSCYKVEVRSATRSDAEATIGYDPPLRTFFLTAVTTDEDVDDTELWLGGLLEEYPTLEGIIKAAKDRGFTISGLRHKNMIAMLAEAGQPAPPSIAEIVGLVR